MTDILTFLLLSDCFSCLLYTKLINKLSAKISKTPKKINKIGFLMVLNAF